MGDDYQVIVGNIGTVYNGGNGFEARKAFNQYISASKSPHGRASGEDVTLFKNGEIEKEFFGANGGED
ncbi:MAG: hypothetical protein INH13_25735 [Cupriavidus sp.]|nr:hypothetical protein [Cupriavidus sp.]